METFSALLAICAGNSPVTGEFPAQRPVTRSFDVFFDLRLNKRLTKQSWGWWFETPSRPLWRHCNGERLCQLALGTSTLTWLWLGPLWVDSIDCTIVQLERTLQQMPLFSLLSTTNLTRTLYFQQAVSLSKSSHTKERIYTKLLELGSKNEK